MSPTLSPPSYVRRLRCRFLLVFKRRSCRAEYHAREDAYWCSTHRRWLEGTCSDRTCWYCTARGAEPVGAPLSSGIATGRRNPDKPIPAEYLR